MYPLIIVEDEPILLNGLAKLVERTTSEFQLAGKASDAYEAMELITTLPPTLVITDIRMPKMDGLELCSWIRDRQPEIKVIIASGYSDFAYAQQAIRLGVVDFLLKPVKPEELSKALGKAKALIDERLFSNAELALEPEVFNLFEELIQAIQLLDPAKAVEKTVLFWNTISKGEVNNQHFDLQQAANILRNIQKRFPEVEITSDIEWVDGLFDLVPGTEPVIKYFEAQINKFISKINDQRNSIGRQAVVKAKEFIESNYAAEISLKEVADAIYLNPSYFSQLFKETTGENFINYLTKVRIEKAKALLKKSDYKVYEVAQAVGYTDQAYFSRIFKQVVGVNPADFRRRLGI